MIDKSVPRKCVGLLQVQPLNGRKQSNLKMTKHDIRVVGVNGGARPYRVAASATRFYAGEPAMRTPTYSSGASNVNTVIVLTDAKPTVATDDFVGVFAKDATGTGTLVAHTTQVIVPIPQVTLIRGRMKTASNVTTDAALILILNDITQFDLTAGAYTIDETATANTSGLQIVNGNTAKGTLDCVVDVRAMKTVIS